MIRVTAVSLLLIWPALALEPKRSGPDPWVLLAQLRAGKKVQVIDVDGRTHHGRLVGWSALAISVDAGGRQLLFAREQVALVKSPGAFGVFKTVYGPWANLGRLRGGETVKLIYKNYSEIEGGFAGYADDGLRLEVGGRPIFVPREQIRKVALLQEGHENKGAEIGAVIGFIAGVALVVAAASQGGSCDGGAEVVEAVTIGGGAVGAAAGSLVRKYQTVYKAPKRP